MNRAPAVLLLAVSAMGCLKAPAIVVVDRGTELEQQASGSFDDVEQRLNRAAATPHPVPLTPEQLEALGLQRPGAAGGTRGTEADEVDLLLVRHCIGEGSDGLLVETPDACRGVPDADEIAHALDSVNRARRQLWRFMRGDRGDLSLDDVRRAWHAVHLAGVVCGGWIQGDDETWRAKPC